VTSLTRIFLVEPGARKEFHGFGRKGRYTLSADPTALKPHDGVGTARSMGRCSTDADELKLRFTFCPTLADQALERAFGFDAALLMLERPGARAVLKLLNLLLPTLEDEEVRELLGRILEEPKRRRGRPKGATELTEKRVIMALKLFAESGEPLTAAARAAAKAIEGGGDRKNVADNVVRQVRRRNRPPPAEERF
jgi:hypothetical protein